MSDDVKTGYKSHKYTGSALESSIDILQNIYSKYNDIEVFVADLHEAISANPLIQFSLVANDSGILNFFWFEDGGKVYSTARKLRVS